LVVPAERERQGDDREHERNNDDRDPECGGSPDHADCSCCLALPIILLAKDPSTLGGTGDFGGFGIAGLRTGGLGGRVQHAPEPKIRYLIVMMSPSRPGLIARMSRARRGPAGHFRLAL